jgi:hypothetical protein
VEVNLVKTIVIAALILACAFGQKPTPAACVPAGVEFKVSKDRSQHPTPTAADGKAVVYLLGEGTIGVDGKWVAAVHDGTYSLMEIDPGEHHLCSVFSTPIPVIFLLWKKVHFASAHSLNAEPGGTYYFQSYGTQRPWGDFTLKQLDPDEGARVVSKAIFSTSHPK